MTELNSDPATKRMRRAVRRFTDEQRQQMVAESYVAGVSVREAAARYDVSANQLSTWRSEFAKKQKNASTSNTVRFASVQVAPPISEGVIEIDVANACIRVRGDVSISMLRDVIGLMR
jgi:transposase-like protein